MKTVNEYLIPHGHFRADAAPRNPEFRGDYSANHATVIASVYFDTF
jgi:hypothetical protein